MQLHYTKCSIDDLDTLVKISRETFSTAFEIDNNPDDFQDYCRVAFSHEKLLEELQHQTTQFYFAHLQKDLVGYFKINEYVTQSDPQNIDSLELERIYVVSDFQGQGVGRSMLSQVINIAQKLKKNYIWLGVWEHNPRAIQFYQRYGFTKFGEHPYFIGNDCQTDWLMRYDL